MPHDHHGPGGLRHAVGVPGQPPVTRAAEGLRMRWVLGLTILFMIVQVVGGLLSGSLALLADAGHMLTDAGALTLALLAMRVAARPASPEKTYGYVRFEILAALINGAVLLLVAVFIGFEAWRRAREPMMVHAPLMLGVAVAGLGVNVTGMVLLHGHARHNLNVRGAYFHILGDLLGSLGTIGAGVVILLTGWSQADLVASVVIALLILVGAWRLVGEAVDVLMEAAPGHIDVAAVVEDLTRVEGLSDVHDVHVWTLTSGFVALSGHGVIDDPFQHTRILEEIRQRMRARGIGHVTFQLEMRPLYSIPPPLPGA